MIKLDCRTCGMPSYSASTAVVTCPYCGKNIPAGTPAQGPAATATTATTAVLAQPC